MSAKLFILLSQFLIFSLISTQFCQIDFQGPTRLVVDGVSKHVPHCEAVVQQSTTYQLFIEEFYLATYHLMYKTLNGQFIVEVVQSDFQMTTLSLPCDPGHQYVFIDAQSQYSLVKKVSGNATVAYILARVNIINGSIALQQRSISADLDSINGSLNGLVPQMILQLSSCDNVAFLLTSDLTTSVYTFDFSTLQMTGFQPFFDFQDNSLNIVGGSSNVLLDVAGDRLITHNGQFSQQYLLSNLSDIELLESKSTIQLRKQNFFLLSVSSDKLDARGFLITQNNINPTNHLQLNLSSYCPIQFFTNNNNFFLAISENDIYIAVVPLDDWDILGWTGGFSYYTITLSQEDRSNQDEILADFNNAIQITSSSYQYFLLTEDSIKTYWIDALDQFEKITDIQLSPDLVKMLQSGQVQEIQMSVACLCSKPHMARFSCFSSTLKCISTIVYKEQDCTLQSDSSTPGPFVAA